MCGSVWQFVVMRSDVWQYAAAMHGSAWQCVAVRGSEWLSMAMRALLLSLQCILDHHVVGICLRYFPVAIIKLQNQGNL